MSESTLNALICIAMGLLTAALTALPFAPPIVLDVRVHLETGERQ